MRTKLLYHEKVQFARGAEMMRKNLQNARKAAKLTQQAVVVEEYYASKVGEPATKP